MKALCWHGKHQITCDTVPDPKIEEPRDGKVTSCAICGSDLHLYDGFMPGMESDIMGHEFMGEVIEVGRENKKLKVTRSRAYHHLRECANANAELLCMRTDQPQQEGRRPRLRSHDRRPVRLADDAAWH